MSDTEAVPGVALTPSPRPSAKTVLTDGVSKERILLEQLLYGVAKLRVHATNDDWVPSVVFGWLGKVLTFARSVAVLSEHDTNPDCAPILRSMVEHWVSMEWLIAEGKNGFDALLERDEHWRYKYAKAVLDTPDGHHAATLDEMKAVLAKGKPPEPQSADLFAQTDNVRRRFENAGQAQLYPRFMLDSANTHATLVSAHRHVAFPDLGGSVRQSPQAIEIALIVVLSSVLAANTILDLPQAVEAPVAAIAELLDIPREP